jgi:glucosamine-6-phosphate deaminase
MGMIVHRSASKELLAREAAAAAASRIRLALGKRGAANIVVATGLSQASMLVHLVREDLDWKRVTAFHLDEYVGIPATHPASFRKYLKERFVDRVPVGTFHPISGEGDPRAECRRLSALIGPLTIDVAFVGIGENGHLAFNDPPADFENPAPYLVVTLDPACRRQQVGEGWFASLKEVPTEAISMSIREIMRAEFLVCSVPDLRKARAVKAALEGPVSPQVPASILQHHPGADIFLDPDSASLLEG